MRLSVITPSTVEPLTLAEAKDHLRVNFTKEDGLISRLIKGSREAFQRDTPRQLLTGTLKGFLDSFPPRARIPIEIAKPPLVSVDAVSYVDTSGVLQTWAASEYTVEAFLGPFAQRGVIYPKPQKEYPQTLRITNSVTIDFDAGYGAAANDVPSDIKDELLVWIGHRYNNRESVIVPWPGFKPWHDADFG